MAKKNAMKVKKKEKTLHQRLMKEFDECLPVPNLDILRVIYNSNHKILNIDGLSSMFNVRDYAVVPYYLVPDCKKAIQGYVLYVNRKH
jgi:hypothetical protein